MSTWCGLSEEKKVVGLPIPRPLTSNVGVEEPHVESAEWAWEVPQHRMGVEESAPPIPSA